jgi:hypothetical protein
MPANNTDTTLETSFTTSGIAYTVPVRYVPGECVLSPGEASALQQTLIENIRNNWVAKVKAAAEEGKTLSMEEFAEYAAAYDFGIRGTRTPSDPVLSAERTIITSKLKVALASQGIDWKTLAEDKQEAFIDRVLAAGTYHAEAERVAEAQAAARAAKAAATAGAAALDISALLAG